ncbi:hypothetical protein HanIR_Chr13g0639371 [Helianthus annuus]|nr:hypothetical protein HanIR_Chr13g0639371 [Helianthus annuus]
MWHNSKKKNKKRVGTGRGRPPSDNTLIDGELLSQDLIVLYVIRLCNDTNKNSYNTIVISCNCF